MTSQDQFIERYQVALERGDAALFAGAGLSVGVGYIDWKKLLRDVATELDLDVDRETDLLALAQYHVHQAGGRGRLNQLIVDEFSAGAALSENHRLLSELPIATVWTTNYDQLLEEAYRDARRRADVKKTEKSLAVTVPRRDVTIYKMHGDVEDADGAIITKHDYETYADKHRGFVMQLQADLLGKTFLFVGFSFTDPNIDYILGRVRALVGTSRREHFCIMRRPPKPSPFKGKPKADYEYDSTKLRHRIADLKSYGIQTVLIDEFTEITDLLRRLHKGVHRRSIFVSGSADDFSPLGRPRLEELCRRIGNEIIKRQYNLVSGYGLGIGGCVLVGALEALHAQPDEHLDDRAVLRPFPQRAPKGVTMPELWRRYRESMLQRSGFAIFLAGNKKRGGKVVNADGVLEEFKIASAANVYPIPVGMTGHAALALWKTVVADPTKFYWNHASKVRGSLNTLNDKNATDEELVEAIFSIVHHLMKT